MQEIPAKTILSAHRDGWFASDYTMNVYRGCCHGCIYCDSRSDCYHVDHFDTVRAKEHALDILESELRRKRNKGIILSGAMSDPYNPFEKEAGLSRGAIKLANKYGFGMVLLTKSATVVSDVDVLSEAAKSLPFFVSMTVTTADDTLCRKIERNVSTTSARFAALRTLRDHGVGAGVLMTPILPFINDTPENVISVIEQAYASKAMNIYSGFGVTLRQNQAIYFYEKLDRLFPGIRRNTYAILAIPICAILQGQRNCTIYL